MLISPIPRSGKALFVNLITWRTKLLRKNSQRQRILVTLWGEVVGKIHLWGMGFLASLGSLPDVHRQSARTHSVVNGHHIYVISCWWGYWQNITWYFITVGFVKLQCSEDELPMKRSCSNKGRPLSRNSVVEEMNYCFHFVQVLYKYFIYFLFCPSRGCFRFRSSNMEIGPSW